MKKGARTRKKTELAGSTRLARRTISNLSQPTANVGTVVLQHDPVNAPQHYRAGNTYETIRVIEAWKLNFHLGNAVKYISRADQKGAPIEDLKKARWYLDREIQKRENHV